MPASWVDIRINNNGLEGYLTQPEAPGKYPAVVVIQEIWGGKPHIQSVVDRVHLVFRIHGFSGWSRLLLVHLQGREHHPDPDHRARRLPWPRHEHLYAGQQPHSAGHHGRKFLHPYLEPSRGVHQDSLHKPGTGATAVDVLQAGSATGLECGH